MIYGARSLSIHLIFFFSLTLAGITLTAQDSSFYLSFPVSVRIAYDPEGKGLSGNSNEIIHTLAEDMIKPPARVRIDFSCHLRVRVERTGDGQTDLFVFVAYPAVTGDTRYRKFGISQVMIPGRMNIRFRIRNKLDSTDTRETEFPALRLGLDGNPVPLGSIRNYAPGRDSLALSSISFSYDDNGLALFNERIHLINDYYASAFVADSMVKLAESIDLKNESLFPLYFLRLQEINRVVSLVGQEGFEEKLRLEGKDSKELLPKYQWLYKFTRSANMTFEEDLQNMGSLQSRLTDSSIIDTLVSGMLRYIRWSLLVNERNGRIYQEYLDNYWTGSTYEKEKVLIKEMLVKGNPGRNGDSLYKSYCLKIQRAYRDKAARLMDQNLYAEAVGLLENESRFYSANPFAKPDSADREIRKRASTGIFASYVGIAENCLQYRRYDMAKDYLAKAQEYSLAHHGNITSDSSYRKVLNDFITVRLADCDSLAVGNDFENAVLCYQVFRNGLDSLTKELVGSVIGQRIAFATLRQLQDSTGRSRYVSELARQLLAGESLIWTNRLDSAGKFADTMLARAQKLGLGEEVIFAESMSNFRRKIGEQSCRNLVESFEILQVRAERDIELKFYGKAGILLDSAVRTAEDNPGCHFPVKPLKDTLEKYQPVISYQHQQDEIEGKVLAGNYPEAIGEYIVNTNSFEAGNLSRFVPPPPSLHDYIETKANPYLTIGAIGYFERIDSLDLAFTYARLLRIQNISRKNARNVIDSLGTRMGGRDFLKFPEEDPSKVVKRYTEGDPWFARFTMAYLTEWKSRRNQAIGNRQ
jgi:hypothetical protein